MASEHDLLSLLDRAQSSRGAVVPLLVFTAPGCPWCELVMAEQLRPRRRSSQLPRIEWLEIGMAERRGRWRAPGANGLVSGQQLSALHNVVAAPTVLALLPNQAPTAAMGAALPRLVGYASRDFYGAYLEDLIQSAAGAWRLG